MKSLNPKIADWHGKRVWIVGAILRFIIRKLSISGQPDNLENAGA